MDRKPGWYTYAAIVLVSILLLIGAYVGAYYAMVRAVPIAYLFLNAREEETIWQPTYARFPWGDGVAFFAPIHSIDRHMRPEVWDPQPY